MEKNLAKKEQRIREKEQLSTVITNKMILVFLALVFAIAVLVRVSATGTRELGFILALPYIRIGFGILTATALAWYIVCKKRGVNERMRVFSSPLLLGLAASGLFAAVMYTGFGGAFRTILALLAFCMLFFVYQIYAVDFYLCSVAAVVGCLAASVVSSAGFGAWKILVSIAAVLLSALASAACVYVVARLEKERKFELFGQKIVRPIHTVPAATYAVAAVSFAAVLAALCFGYLLYCIAAIAVVYVVVAILYTVKLM